MNCVMSTVSCRSKIHNRFMVPLQRQDISLDVLDKAYIHGGKTMVSSRRDFMFGTLVAGAAFAMGGMTSRAFAAAPGKVKVVSLEECVSMTPRQMAESSAKVMDAWRYMKDSAGEIVNASLRGAVLDMLENPAPRVAKNDEKALVAELKKAKLLEEKAAGIFPACAGADKAPQPSYSAPGSGWGSHHAYPGGLVTHVALNVASAKALCDNYRTIFHMEVDRDVALASQLLHDVHKPWVFQWKDDASCLPEASIAGTGAHHILSVAESMNKGLPAEVCVAQACAHDHPGTSALEASVVNWIRAAAIIAGKDPVANGYLEKDGKTLPLPRRPEGFVTHLADHDWVLSVPAAQWLTAELKKIAAERYNIRGKDLEGRVFNSFRNYVLSQRSAMELYNIYSKNGASRLAEEVSRGVTA